jgi:hypothetical protein
MAAPHMTADVSLSVRGIEAVVGSANIPLKTTTGEAADGSVPVSVNVDMDGFKTTLADLLRAVANEIENESENG